LKTGKGYRRYRTSAPFLLEAMRNTAGKQRRDEFQLQENERRLKRQEKAFGLIHNSIKDPIFSFFAEEQTPQERDW
jgi:hypothetical protein